jgi:apolipoprotein N-acyltransferase
VSLGGVKPGPYALAFIAGAASVIGFQPGWSPVLLAAFALLVHLWVSSGRSGFWLGFAYGLGLYGVGVSWVYISMNRFGGLPAPLAALATLGFCALLALFPALVGWAQARLPNPSSRPLAIPALWVLVEWLRGWLLTGFPWLGLGYGALDTPLAGYAPVGGVLLVTLAATGAALFLRQVAAGERRWLSAALFGAIGIGGAALQAVQWTTPAARPVRVSLLQGNVEQSLKFDPARFGRILETYAGLAEESRARLIVLPETAVPRFLDSVPPQFLARLDATARRNNGDLLLGVPLRTGPGMYYNSVISLGASPRAVYSKVHLVPFGEFVPPGFRWFVDSMAIPLADFSRGAPTQRPLAVAGERVAVNICYEDAYGDEIVRQLPEATLLVNVSNVAWFGDSLAPGQHLQIARMRALETGRMHLTATNTGITAAIAADGTVLARLPQFGPGKLEIEARGRTGATPYVALVDGPALALSALLLFFCAARRRRSS